MHEYTLQELMSLYHSRRVKNKANMPNERQEQQQKKINIQYTRVYKSKSIQSPDKQ